MGLRVVRVWLGFGPSCFLNRPISAPLFSKLVVRAARWTVLFQRDSVGRVATVFLCMIRVPPTLAGHLNQRSDCVFPRHFNSSFEGDGHPYFGYSMTKRIACDPRD